MEPFSPYSSKERKEQKTLACCVRRGSAWGRKLCQIRNGDTPILAKAHTSSGDRALYVDEAVAGNIRVLGKKLETQVDRAALSLSASQPNQATSALKGSKMMMITIIRGGPGPPEHLVQWAGGLCCAVPCRT